MLTEANGANMTLTGDITTSVVKGIGVLFPGAGTLRGVFSTTDASGKRVLDEAAWELVGRHHRAGAGDRGPGGSGVGVSRNAKSDSQPLFFFFAVCVVLPLLTKRDATQPMRSMFASRSSCEKPSPFERSIQTESMLATKMGSGPSRARAFWMPPPESSKASRSNSRLPVGHSAECSISTLCVPVAISVSGGSAR